MVSKNPFWNPPKRTKKPQAKNLPRGPRKGMTWEQVHRINSRRRVEGYRESDALGERMARDRDP
jgi:hypothetical protein